MINLTTKIEKKKLIDIIKQNRVRHEQEYKKALDVFKKEYLVKLKDFELQAQSGTYHLHLNLTKPVEYVKEYDKALRMLELTKDVIIELEPHLFSCLVEDEWIWKNDFLNNTSVYLNR